jgi:hypothetical protein
MDSSTDFRDINKEELGTHGPVRFVEKHDDGRAHIRFEDPAAATACAASCKTIAGKEVTIELLEGDAEKEYWEGLWENQARGGL